MNKKFAVMNHEYYNTGGNCMVSIFTVYDKQEKATKYVLMNDEGFNLATVDHVSNYDLLVENDIDVDDVILGSWTFDVLTNEPSFDQHQFTEEEYALYKYCQFEFYKKDCEYFNRWTNIPVDWLPGEMYNELGQEAALWHDQNHQLVSTNGYEVKASEYFDPEAWHQHCKELQQLKDFQSWHDEYYKYDDYDDYVLSVAGRSVKLSFNADTYEAVAKLLKNI